MLVFLGFIVKIISENKLTETIMNIYIKKYFRETALEFQENIINSNL
jgi:hypothetical protein